MHGGRYGLRHRDHSTRELERDCRLGRRDGSRNRRTSRHGVARHRRLQLERRRLHGLRLNRLRHDERGLHRLRRGRLRRDELGLGRLRDDCRRHLRCRRPRERSGHGSGRSLVGCSDRRRRRERLRRGGWGEQHGQQRRRVDVALLLVRAADAEVHVRIGREGIGARPHPRDRRALGDHGATGHERLAELEQGDGEPVGRLDRDRATTLRDGADEGHEARHGCEHTRTDGRSDVDASVLSCHGLGRDRERVRTQDRPLDGPRPGERDGGEGRRRDRERREHDEQTSSSLLQGDRLSPRGDGACLRGRRLETTLAACFSRFSTISRRECYERCA